jgi:6-pyruvoyltetrahydropterin/6-carboxytetrahydropterin synthase
MFELRRSFHFDAAHTLIRSLYADESRRIHGHSYKAEIALRGEPDPASGMIMDLGVLDRMLQGVRDALDHRFLDDIATLGPATLENLSIWIWRQLKPQIPGLARVTVMREASGDACSYEGGG